MMSGQAKVVAGSVMNRVQTVGGRFFRTA